MATIDYMICTYGPYSASIADGNTWPRDIPAGVLTIPATPFFTKIGGKGQLVCAPTILFYISFVLVIAVQVIYWKSLTTRQRSPLTQLLSDPRAEKNLSRRAL